MQVQAYVYDISQGMVARMSMSLVGTQVDLIPHTGIVAFGKEYYFGSGPLIGEPGKTVPVPVTQILDLGTTEKTCEELEAHIFTVLALEHTSEKYNLLSHNCNHFANDVAKFLLGGDKGLPDSIVNVAEEALSTPRGHALRGIIETMEKSMRANMGGASSLNPFGNSSGSVPAAAGAPAAAPSGEGNPELEAALEEIAGSGDVEVRRTALQTLLKITENVEKNPGDIKFRRIKMANAVFTKKVASCNGGVEAMVAAGWLPDCTPDGEDVWLMSDEEAAKQAMPRQRFAAELAKLPPAPNAPRQETPVPAAPAPSPGFGGLGGPGGLGGMGGLGGLGGPGGGMPNPAMMQQMMQNPAMMQQAQQMMQNNPQMAQMAQQMMQNPQMMSQVQQMMQNMGGGGGGGFGGGL